MTNSSKFSKMLTSTEAGIKTKRASILESSTLNSFTTKINGIKDEISQKELAVEQLTDIAPENTYDLKPGGKNFSPKNWVNELTDLKIELYKLNIRLEIIMEAKNEWFGEDDSLASDK